MDISIRNDNRINLCDSPFWDTAYTWNSTEARFTECFRNTLVIWVPPIILILAIFHHLIVISNNKFLPISWNKYNIARLINTFALILTKLTEILDELYNSYSMNNNVSNGSTVAWILSPMIQFISYVILFLIYNFQRKAGIHTNGFVWFYTMTLLICETIRYIAILTYAPIIYYSSSYKLAEYCHFPLIVMLFCLECYGDQPNLKYERLEGHSAPQKVSPELSASYYSRFTFEYITKFIWFGYKNDICESDLWKPKDGDLTGPQVARFMKAWLKPCVANEGCDDKFTYQSSDGSRYKRNYIFKVLLRLHWHDFIMAFVFKFAYDIMFLAAPMTLKYLIRFMSSNEPHWHGIFYASLFMLVPTLQSLFLGQHFWIVQMMGIHTRSMVRGAVYRKSFHLSNSSKQASTSGEMVNLMAVDAQRFEDLLIVINYIWSSPFQFTLALLMLYRELGWAVFAGLLAIIVLMPILALIARTIKVAQANMMNIKDQRMKQINEILNGIKVIKLYAWENSFMQNIADFRSKELRCLRKIYNLDAGQVFIWNTAPVIMAVCAFAVYILTDKNNIMDAEKAFVSLSLFAILKFPLSMLPIFLNIYIQTSVSANRINKFLNSDELVDYINRVDPEPVDDGRVIWIENGNLSWTTSTSTTTTATTCNTNQNNHNHSSNNDEEVIGQNVNPDLALSDINLQVKKGSFIAIVGQVGSGKSSLISGLLGQMNYISGQFQIDKSSRIAYVPQEAWLQNLSLRNNITFSLDYDEEKYKKVIEACSLREDLRVIPGGDEAEIGEKGINLSGGQKQRISLARACYSNSDIILMDDPLSALDSHVAKHVYNEVLSSKGGLLRDKTRILATNSLFVLPYVDHIIVLRNGQLSECGSYKQLMSLNNGLMADMMRQYNINQSAEPDSKSMSQMSNNSELAEQEEQKIDFMLAAKTQARKNSTSQSEMIDEPKLSGGKLIDAEDMETGSVSMKVYLSYFKTMSFKLLITCVFFLGLASSLNVSTSIWLSIWSEDSKDPAKSTDEHLRTVRILVYGSLVGSNCLMVIFATLALAMGVVRASKLLHKNLLDGIMHSPMAFFDTTPLGRITNRFSKDIDVIDSTIPTVLRVTILCALNVTASILLIGFTYPKLLIGILPLAVLYYVVQKIFIVTTRQLKRLESTTRSPIFSNYAETLSGMPIIKAYDCRFRFINRSDHLVDLNNSCSIANIMPNRWLALRLELMGTIMLTAIAFFSVLSKGTISAGLVGLVLSYSGYSVQFINLLVRMTSDLETNIVSVERVLNYSDNKQEDDWIKDTKPSQNWPSAGSIEICNYSTRYRQETPIVLNNINVNIKPGEKIGILGRTGSGKSSLSLSLFRILEAVSGKICIDGEDIAQFGLHDVRSKLTIIPQDPVLFSGTVRFNLDPLELYSDIEIWHALELAHLRNHINGLESGLDFKVSESGDNFSLGQKQLICLARAILRKSKILVLDEATASVDIETDSLVQKTIRDVFKECTIITIAHRIHTILDSDRILVLEQGIVKELDKPQALITNPDSAFVSLLRDAGIDRTRILSLPIT